MCGLSGVIRGGNLIHDADYADFVEQSLYTTALRGFHGSGLFTVDDKHASYFMKDALEARVFLGQSRITSFIRSVSHNTRVMALHNRHATSGGRGYDATHPHTAPNIVLMHNGTLQDYMWMPEHTRSDSDSARLATALSQEDSGGLDVLKRLRGAYALVWYDLRNKHLYIARNAERSLSYVQSDGDLFWASEGLMLPWLLSRRHAVVESTDPVSFPIHTLHSYDLTKKIDITTPELTPYEPPPAKVFYSASPGASFVAYKGKENTFELSNKRIKKVNNLLLLRGIKVKVGDLVELMVGNFAPYAENGSHGMVQAWADDITGSITMPKFTGQLWADVHGVNAADFNKKGVQRDSIKARVKSVKPAENKGDLIMVCEFMGHGMFRETHKWHDELLEEFFEGERWRFGPLDHAKFPCGNFRLTERELVSLTNRMNCKTCDISGTRVPTPHIVMEPDGVGFKCLDCATKGGSKVVTPFGADSSTYI